MPIDREVQPKPLPSDLANRIHQAARDLWLFVNSEYREGNGASLVTVSRRHLDAIHALRAIAADIAFSPDYVLRSGSDQRSAMEHAISILRYAPDWFDKDRAEAIALELEGRVEEADQAVQE